MKGDMKTVNLPEKFPHIPGFDFSGVIEQVGKNVKGYSVGDEVFGTNDKTNGCMAELVLTRPEWIARKPKMLTHVEGKNQSLDDSRRLVLNSVCGNLCKDPCSGGSSSCRLDSITSSSHSSRARGEKNGICPSSMSCCCCG